MEISMVILFIFIGLLGSIILDLRAENQKLKDELSKETRDMKHFSDRVRTFMWAICNQQEKAQSALETMVRFAYKKETEDNQKYVFKKVKERIGL